MAIVGPRILEIDSVILKLSRFPQVQSEREWTLGFAAMTSTSVCGLCRVSTVAT